MVEVERADAHRRPDMPEQGSRGRRAAHERDVALRGDERIESVEQDANRRGEAQAFGTGPRAVEQKRAGRLQLLRQRRLLSDRRAIGRFQIEFGIEDRGDRAQIEGELADQFACDEAAGARMRDDGGEEGEGDVDEAARGEQRLDADRRRQRFPRESEHEHHRNECLHADGEGPPSHPGDHSAGERDPPDRQERGRRPGLRELNRSRCDQREREAEAHRARLLPPGRGKVGNAGGNRAQRRRLAGAEAEERGRGQGDSDHAYSNRGAIDDVLADEQPLQVGRSKFPHG